MGNKIGEEDNRNVSRRFGPSALFSMSSCDYEAILRGPLFKEYVKTGIDMRLRSRSVKLFHSIVPLTLPLNNSSTKLDVRSAR